MHALTPASRQHHLAHALAALRARDTGAVHDACRHLQPDDPDALLLAGLAHAIDSNHADAAATLCALATRRPDHAHPATDLASLLPLDDRRPIDLLRACLDRMPDDRRVTHALADRLTETGAPDQALALLAIGLAQTPDDPTLLNLAGIAHGEAGRYQAAETAFRAAIAADDTRAVAWSNLGMTLKTLGRHADAIGAHDKAVALSPRDAQLQLNRAIAILRAGRLREGFAAFEWRLALPGHTTLPPDRLMPSLGALDRLDGKTILVTHEEGFGDTLQCARYLPRLAALGARIVAWVPDALVRLIGRVDGVAETIPTDASPPPYHHHCPFLSLPRVFATTLDTIPWSGPYLAADPALVADFARDMPTAGPRIGLVWAGQARPWQMGFANLDRRRGMIPDTLAPLAQLDAMNFVSLQYLAAATPAFADPRAITRVQDFADTAAIIANLDAVISVDTAVAHLAGGLGVPTYLLDRHDGCWRWLHARADTAWYPSMTILRQPTPGDWQTPIAQLGAQLGARLAIRQTA